MDDQGRSGPFTFDIARGVYRRRRGGEVGLQKKRVEHEVREVLVRFSILVVHVVQFQVAREPKLRPISVRLLSRDDTSSSSPSLVLREGPPVFSVLAKLLHQSVELREPHAHSLAAPNAC